MNCCVIDSSPRIMTKILAKQLRQGYVSQIYRSILSPTQRLDGWAHFGFCGVNIRAEELPKPSKYHQVSARQRHQ